MKTSKGVFFMVEFMKWYFQFVFPSADSETLFTAPSIRYAFYANALSFYALFIAGVVGLFWALISAFMHFKGGAE